MCLLSTRHSALRTYFCAGTYVGSLVRKSITDPYAVTRPVPPVTFTVMRPLYVLPGFSPARTLFSCRNSLPASVTSVDGLIFESGRIAATCTVTGFPVTVQVAAIL